MAHFPISRFSISATIVYIGIFIFTLYTYLNINQRAISTNTVGIVRRGYGTIEYRNQSDNNWMKVVLNQSLAEKTVISTGPKSWADVQLTSGEVISIGERSQVFLTLEKTTSRESFLVDLIQGHIQIRKDSESTPKRPSATSFRQMINRVILSKENDIRIIDQGKGIGVAKPDSGVVTLERNQQGVLEAHGIYAITANDQQDSQAEAPENVPTAIPEELPPLMLSVPAQVTLWTTKPLGQIADAKVTFLVPLREKDICTSSSDCRAKLITQKNEVVAESDATTDSLRFMIRAGDFIEPRHVRVYASGRRSHEFSIAIGSFYEIREKTIRLDLFRDSQKSLPSTKELISGTESELETLTAGPSLVFFSRDSIDSAWPYLMEWGYCKVVTTVSSNISGLVFVKNTPQMIALDNNMPPASQKSLQRLLKSSVVFRGTAKQFVSGQPLTQRLKDWATLPKEVLVVKKEQLTWVSRNIFSVPGVADALPGWIDGAILGRIEWPASTH